AEGAYLNIVTNVGIRGRSAGLRPGGSGEEPGNAAGSEAGARSVVVSRSPAEERPQRGVDFAWWRDLNDKKPCEHETFHRHEGIGPTQPAPGCLRTGNGRGHARGRSP